MFETFFLYFKSIRSFNIKNLFLSLFQKFQYQKRLYRDL